MCVDTLYPHNYIRSHNVSNKIILKFIEPYRTFLLHQNLTDALCIIY